MQEAESLDADREEESLDDADGEREREGAEWGGR